MNKDVIIQGDAIEVMGGMPAASVQCVVTSPPYWGLRDYGIKGQLGLEKTPEEYVAKMVEVFQQVRRVLRDDGTLWLNLGDSYASAPKNRTEEQATRKSTLQGGLAGQITILQQQNKVVGGLKPKDLCEIPSDVVRALRADGWWLRARLPWLKRNPMPESANDRPNSAIEYVFLLTKSARCYFDMEAVRVRSAPATIDRDQYSRILEADGPQRIRHDHETPSNPGGRHWRNADLFFESLQPPHGMIFLGDEPVGFDVNPQGFPEAHFATFPEWLVRPCIKAGTSEKGCCPECGGPWIRMVEKRGGSIGKSWHDHSKDDTEGQRITDPTAKGSIARCKDDDGNTYQCRTIGWQPGCKCGEYQGKHAQADKQAAGCRMLLNQRAARKAGGDHNNPFGAKQTVGWKGSCECATKPIPCTVLDPFAGSGTACMVAAQLGRSYIGIELNEEYCEMARARIGSALAPETYTKADKPEDGPLFAEQGAPYGNE